jgi:hypothetical protein
MSGHNRSTGWQFAKIDGHKYEEVFAKKVMDLTDVQFQNSLKICLMKFKKTRKIKSCDSSIGKRNVNGIFNEKTQSKTDAQMIFDDDDFINISIKKPSTESGQVHLSTLKNFCKSIEYFTHRKIPSDVEWILRAFTGETDGKEIKEYVGNNLTLHSPIITKHNKIAWVIG